MNFFLYLFILLYFIIFILSLFLASSPSKYSEYRKESFQPQLFFVAKDMRDSTKMRAEQIINKLYNKGFVAKTILISDIKDYYAFSNSIFIWLGPIGNDHIPRFKSKHYHVLDFIDKYVYEKEEIDYGLHNNFYSALLVNNESMKTYFQTRTKAKIYVIHHHHDPRYNETLTTIPKTKLKFGYTGSILSLFHSYNFLYFQKLAKMYDIIFFDTEYGIDVSAYIDDYEKLYNFLHSKPKYITDNLPQKVEFNCDISIRPYGSDLCKFKTTSKVATAAILGHNIITTYDDSVKDVLSPDYPFLLRHTDFDSVKSMFEKVINDFHGSKVLWRKGLRMMEDVKHKLSLDNIVKSYMNALKLYNLSITDFKGKIMGVYHIGCVGTFYMDIIKEQLSLLKESNLYKVMNKLVIFISNYDHEKDKKLLMFLKNYDTDKKLKINFTQENKMEKYAINNFRDYIEKEQYVFYFHTKAVSHNREAYWENWRKILDFYTIKKWTLNVNILQKYDAVGCFLSQYPSIHFSGNYWWATTKYLYTLPKNCGTYYLSPEMWIGLGGGNMISLSNNFKSNFENHKHRTDKEIYDNLTKCMIIIEANKYVKY